MSDIQNLRPSDYPYPQIKQRPSAGCAAASGSAPSGVEALVCDDIAKRQRVGMNKYGVTVADNPLDLRQWLNHAYEECLDQAVYLKRAMVELDRLNDPAHRQIPGASADSTPNVE